MAAPVEAPGYHLFTFRTDVPEVLIAFLSEYPFEAFSEEPDVIGYLPEHCSAESIEDEIRSTLSGYFEHLTVSFQPGQNWNAVWESNFTPVQIREFCHVRASFHAAVNDVEHEIVIDPKMAFGTGHHATTYMMIDTMSSLDFGGTSVLDMGCGTGVLAILAAKLGAVQVVAIDNDPAAVENTLENQQVNNVEFDVLLGSDDVIPRQPFDVILANINRGVLIPMLGRLHQALSPQGQLIISGILEDDETVMVGALEKAQLQVIRVSRRSEWICLLVRRSG